MPPLASVRTTDTAAATAMDGPVCVGPPASATSAASAATTTTRGGALRNLSHIDCPLDLRCGCGRGVSYAAVRDRAAPLRHNTSTVGLQRAEDLARSYIERGLVRLDCDQAALDAHYKLLCGMWWAPKGMAKAALLDAVYKIDSEERLDSQFESINGQFKQYEELEQLKRKRDDKDVVSGKRSSGYRRPNRIHRSHAHRCTLHHSLLDFYGRMWVRGADKIEEFAYTMESRHFLYPHMLLVDNLKEVFWPVLNDESKNAV